MTFTCNKERMLRLVEALESGEYEQTRRTLRQGDAFCCLGVACDLASKEGIGTWLLRSGGEYRFNADGRQEGASMPPSAVKFYGLDDDDDAIELLDDLGFPITALSLNDTGSSFAEIAAAIRRHYGLPATSQH